MMIDKQPTRIHLQHAELPHSVRGQLFRKQYDFIDIYWNDVGFSTANLRHYLAEPDRLISVLHEVMQFQEQIVTGTYRNCEQLFNVMPPEDIWFNKGLMLPTNGVWERADRSDDYLTVSRRDMRTWEYTSVAHYIRLDLHEQKLRDAQLNIAHIVEQGVRSGVEKAIGEGKATLTQIENERERLEKERARIDRQLEKLKEAEEKVKTRPRNADPSGYVYLLQSSTGYYKIGRARNPNNRMATFGVKLPFEVEYRHLIKTDDMFALEAELHRRYADCRVNGEWFNLSDEQVAEICKRN